MAKTVLIDADAIRKQIETDPAVQAAGQRLARAHTRLAEVQAEIDRIMNELERSKKLETDERAARMLYDDDVTDQAIETLTAALNKTRETADLLQRAVRLGLAEADHARMAAAGKVLEDLKPELKQRQRDLIGRYASAALAIKDYRDRLAHLRSGGIVLDMDHVYAGSLTSGAEYNSPFFTWCESLIGRGLLQWSDIPEPLRRAWGVQS
jgi:hypothetical protein